MGTARVRLEKAGSHRGHGTCLTLARGQCRRRAPMPTSVTEFTRGQCCDLGEPEAKEHRNILTELLKATDFDEE